MGENSPDPVKKKVRVARRRTSLAEKRAVNAAFGILAGVGGLLVYSAINEKFKIPAEMWGLSTAAAAYLFGTSRRSGDDEEGEGDDGE